MQHRRMRRKLGVKSEHRIALLRNLVRNLVIHKRIRTTLMKAKEASSFSDRMIEIAKKGDLHSRRLLVSRLRCTRTVNSLIKEIAPRFEDRHGGYTRVLKLPPRPGDGAGQAILEFSVPFESTTEKREKAKASKRTKGKKKAAAPAEEKPTPKKAVPKKKVKPKGSAEEETPKPESRPEEKKESEKKGGFLGTLRKFLKGDE